MVKVCFLCKRTFEKASSRSYHMFPADTTSRQQWFQALGLIYVQTKNIYLCSDHFSQDSFYVQPSGRRVLKKGATPSKLSTISTTSSSECDESTSSSTRSEMVMEARDPLALTGPWETVTEFKSDPELAVPLSPSTSATKSASESVEAKESLYVNGIPQKWVELIEDKQEQSHTPSSDSSQESVQQGNLKKKKFLIPRYMGDVGNDELLNPRIAKMSWELAVNTVKLQKKKIICLQQQNRRLKAKVSCLETLVKHLRKT